MAIDKRVHQLLDLLVNNPFLSGTDLEKKLALTRKQISYALSKLNSYLESKNFPRINRLKNGRFVIDESIIIFFKNRNDIENEEHTKTKPSHLNYTNRYIYSENERIVLLSLIIMIRENNLSLLHLTSALKVSQNTIINDIKKSNPLMIEHGLTISYSRDKGYHVSGDEIKKRYAILSLVRKVLVIPYSKDILTKLISVSFSQFKLMRDFFIKVEENIKIQFTDDQLKELTYFLCCVIQRIKQHKIIDSIPNDFYDVINSDNFNLLKPLYIKLDINDIQEQAFLTVLIQSSNIQKIADKYFQIDTVLFKSVVDVINEFEIISCINVKDKQELTERIYQHWKPAYYRIKYNLSNINSVYEIVLQEFGYLHEIVKRAIKSFENTLNCNMPDEEIAFITVLFGGWLTREGTINQLKSKKIAIFVCENSATLSTYLYLTLQVLFPELHFSEAMSKREFDSYKRYYDVVFSTSSLKTDKLFFLVNPDLNVSHKNTFRNNVIRSLQGMDPTLINVDDLIDIIMEHSNVHNISELKRKISEYIYHEKHNDIQISQNIPSLRQVLKKEHIQIELRDNLKWEEAIKIAAQPLLNKSIIEPMYIEKIIEKIIYEQPYILLAEGLIIAHAGIHDGVNDIGMSLLKLPKKINIANYIYSDLIVVLGTNNPQLHLKALAQLNDFLEFHDGANLIRKQDSVNDIYSVLPSIN